MQELLWQYVYTGLSEISILSAKVKEYRSQLQARCRFTPILGYQLCLFSKYPTVAVKCRTVIKTLLLYFNLCLSVTLGIVSCWFTSIFFHANLSLYLPALRLVLCLTKSTVGSYKVVVFLLLNDWNRLLILNYF